MSVTLRFDGLEELKEAMRNLPADLTSEALAYVDRRGNAAANSIRAIYGQHRVSGHLQGGVRVTRFEGGKFSAAVKVKSSAPHAWIFENGTEVRHYVTVNGVTHVTGRSPAHPAFIPMMQMERRGLWGDFKAMLERHGLLVRGDAA